MYIVVHVYGYWISNHYSLICCMKIDKLVYIFYDTLYNATANTEGNK